MKIGDLVVCTNDTGLPSRVGLIKQGRVYTVISIREYGKGVGVCLEEVKKTIGIEWSDKSVTFDNKIPYSASRFTVIDCPVNINIETEEEALNL